jgi:hypothetical protein
VRSTSDFEGQLGLTPACSARAREWPTGQSSVVCSCLTMQGMPSAAVVTTGRPDDIPSRIESGKLSRNAAFGKCRHARTIPALFRWVLPHKDGRAVAASRSDDQYAQKPGSRSSAHPLNRRELTRLAMLLQPLLFRKESSNKFFEPTTAPAKPRRWDGRGSVEDRSDGSSAQYLRRSG